MNRRKFINRSLLIGSSLLFPQIINSKESKHHASFYQKLAENKVQCHLCPHQCILTKNQVGICRNRKNVSGELRTLNYGEIAAFNVDPVEKKPFYHFLPGELAFSIAATGCNLRCQYCQNWEISQISSGEIKTKTYTPQDIVEYCTKNNIPVIAYTYTEPVIFYEYMIDIARLAKDEGIKNVMISAGYIDPSPLKELVPYLDAIKIDLKSFSDSFYQKICKGRLKPVLDSLVEIKKSDTWLEIVYLVVPELNDSKQEILECSQWIKTNLGSDVPLHFSRFSPQYKLRNLPVTPVATIERAIQTSRESGINYAYAGNLPGHADESTYCPQCGQILIKRYGYQILEMNIKNNRCDQCQQSVAGFWKT